MVTWSHHLSLLVSCTSGWVGNLLGAAAQVQVKWRKDSAANRGCASVPGHRTALLALFTPVLWSNFTPTHPYCSFTRKRVVSPPLPCPLPFPTKVFGSLPLATPTAKSHVHVRCRLRFLLCLSWLGSLSPCVWLWLCRDDWLLRPPLLR